VEFSNLNWKLVVEYFSLHLFLEMYVGGWVQEQTAVKCGGLTIGI